MATLGGTAWKDTNNDGIQNDGNIGVSCIKVSLLNAYGTETGKYAFTDCYGNYAFTGLAAGTYSVKFSTLSLPNGKMFAQQDIGSNNNIDSDANSTTGITEQVTLTAYQTNLSLDAGVIKSATVSDRVWLDTDNDGIQDYGEQGAAGSTVILWTPTPLGPAAVANTVSDANGNYSFTVAPGSYFVEFRAPSAQPGFRTLTLQDQGSNDAVDSDVNPLTGQTNIFTLAAGQNNKSIDAGFQLTTIVIEAQKGLWLDANSDGVKDDTEVGIGNVQVQLLTTGADRIVGNQDDVLLQTVLTSNNPDTLGDYVFAPVPINGDYEIRFGLPAGRAFTLKDVDVGADPGVESTNDSDADANGFAHVLLSPPTFTSAGQIEILGFSAGIHM
jgi:hypothetical protein